MECVYVSYLLSKSNNQNSSISWKNIDIRYDYRSENLIYVRCYYLYHCLWLFPHHVFAFVYSGFNVFIWKKKFQNLPFSLFLVSNAIKHEETFPKMYSILCKWTLLVTSRTFMEICHRYRGGKVKSSFQLKSEGSLNYLWLNSNHALCVCVCVSHIHLPWLRIIMISG